MSDPLSIFQSEGQSSGTADVPLTQDHATQPPTLIICLSWIGWVHLLVGFMVGGWLIITGMPGVYSDAMPMRIGLGVGLLVEAAIACALFLGFASILENLTVIRRRLES